MALKMTEREKSLCIDYSLRIGTSLYHVLGKRRQGRRNKFDYYIMDDKLVRSRSNRRPSRPRYVFHAEAKKKKAPRPRTVSPPRVQLNIEEIKNALAETMDAERDRIVASLRAAMAEENEATIQTIRDADKPSTELIKRTVREALSAQNELSTPLVQMEERLVQTVEREVQKVRSDAEVTRKEKKKEEEERIIGLIDKQNQALTDAFKEQQQQATTASLDQMKKLVTETIQEQQKQQKPVSLNDITQLESRLADKIIELVSVHHTIKILKDIDEPARTGEELAQIQKIRKEKKKGNHDTDHLSSTEQKQSPKAHSPQQQSTISHKREEGSESNTSDSGDATVTAAKPKSQS